MYSPEQCSTAPRHLHQNHFLQFGLDRSLLYIEMAQIQLHLACYRSHQADTWRGGGGGKRLMVINSRALAIIFCYHSRFRFHYLTFSSDFHVYTHFVETTFPPFCC